MTGPALLAEALLLVAVVLAVQLAHPSRLPHHRPAALALACLLVLDASREGLRLLVLQPARATLGAAPYVGGVRVAFRVEQGLLLAFVAVEVAFYLHAFAKAPPWLVGGPLLLAWGYVASHYPGLRGAPLLAVYGHVHAGAALLGMGLALYFVRQVARGWDWPSPRHGVALVLLASDVGMLGGPYLAPSWVSAHVLNCCAYGLVCLSQGRALWTCARSRVSPSSPSG